MHILQHLEVEFTGLCKTGTSLNGYLKLARRCSLWKLQFPLQAYARIALPHSNGCANLHIKCMFEAARERFQIPIRIAFKHSYGCLYGSR